MSPPSSFSPGIGHFRNANCRAKQSTGAAATKDAFRWQGSAPSVTSSLSPSKDPGAETRNFGVTRFGKSGVHSTSFSTASLT
ncbi:hypothetical protein PAXRUDRAFT_21360 [Paxillus rubicundulus Ve08.2h10]|uniref:Uncharacterized protein n=1 Tax=Paxillus rubicundulus Ve08.2h10 TaxID=930991 RepID=A0A0D0CQB4_9AGAM|nr:hypothetical protein PAXRUDRAFT_21360 [Paxillus rubicundulus Ve08.2h10]